MVIRYLLRNWIHRTAQRKVRQSVADAARQHLHTEEPEDATSDRPAEPCDLGVVFALGIEAGALEERLSGTVIIRGDGLVVRQGLLQGKRVAIVRCGAGGKAAAKATEALISGHQPRWVLAAGLAGGLSAELKRHDILMVDHLVDTAGNRLEIDLKVDRESIATLPGVRIGRLLSADRIIRRPDEKLALGRQHDAVAVDMESFAVAEVCRRRKVPLLAVRVINDTADEELPPDVENLLAQKTKLSQLGAVTGAVWRRPASVKDMYRLRENALAASERLAGFLADMVGQL
ncbi:MAG: hypothetical protein HQ567_05300 [Candidatus Nealsonbacteria bacterium]|nr:hypothetical protein [Candidatus Nealsonbacteria bacterium]